MDEFAPCTLFRSEGGASTMGAVLLGGVLDFQELVGFWW